MKLLFSLIACAFLLGCQSLSGNLLSGDADLTNYRLKANGSVVGLGVGVDADLARPGCLVAEAADELAPEDTLPGPFVRWCRMRQVDAE